MFPKTTGMAAIQLMVCDSACHSGFLRRSIAMAAGRSHSGGTKAMKKTIGLICTSLALLVTACSPEAPVPIAGSEALLTYVTLDKNLTQLKADFNAAHNKVRLVFISGPSCGICLRGTDDLNRSIVASLQNDPRVHTFVVYVPALGAEEKHVQAAIPLMTGPRVGHYWDEEGNSGLDFQDALNIPMYAWDVWMVYQPGQLWAASSIPPVPVFWQHQLPGLPAEQRLDADKFAQVVREELVGVTEVADGVPLSKTKTNEAGLIPVSQPRGVMIQHNHESRGGYQQLKSISAIHYEGWMEVGGKSYPLTVEAKRPDQYRRTIRDGDELSTISLDGSVVTQEGSNSGITTAYTRDWLVSWEFDGWMTDWKKKGHQVWRLGMKKFGNRLPWIMEAELSNGQVWNIYVDSHTGDAFRQAMIGSKGEELLVLEFDDYRDVDGFRLPHQVRYFEGEQILATDHIERVTVSMN